MVNNSVKIRPLLSFEKDDFYFVQVVKRKKDNPLQERSTIVVRNYYINSFEEYDKLIPQIKRLCDFEDARAYFRLNKRNYKHLGMKVLNRALTYISSNNNKPICNVFDSVAGEFHNDPIKKWVVDIDDVDLNNVADSMRTLGISEKLVTLQLQTKNEPMVDILTTKSGVHIITRPFNLIEFKKTYPELDVHKDAVTLLYCS